MEQESGEGSGEAKPITLTAIGYEVLALFTNILRTSFASGHQDLDYGTFRNEHERFDLWAVNLGLYQTGHGSLDYRLRDGETIWRFTEALLLELRLALERNADQALPVTDWQYQHSSGASSPQSSDGEDEDYLVDYNDESSVLIALKSITDSIDRLFKLSMKLRNPNTRRDLSSADSYEKRDPDTKKDLMLLYEAGDVEHARYTIAQYRKRTALQTSGRDVDDIDLHSVARELNNDFLVERLGGANTRRRRRFEYWSHHRLNLSHHAEAAKFRVEDESKKPAAILGRPHTTFTVATTHPTTATYLDVAKVDITDDKSVVSGTSLVVPEESIENQEDGIDVPELPSSLRDHQNIKEFECPYCFTVCSKRYLRRSAWRTHVLKDLRPYVCTYKDCKASDLQFDSFAEWVTHEVTAHELREHASVQQHTSGLLDVTQSSPSNVSPVTTARFGTPQRQCPLCLKQFPSTNDLHPHLAFHLQRIALFALPRFNDLDDEDAINAKAGSADAVADSHFDRMMGKLENDSHPSSENEGSGAGSEPEGQAQKLDDYSVDLPANELEVDSIASLQAMCSTVLRNMRQQRFKLQADMKLRAEVKAFKAVLESWLDRSNSPAIPLHSKDVFVKTREQLKAADDLYTAQFTFAAYTRDQPTAGAIAESLGQLKKLTALALKVEISSIDVRDQGTLEGAEAASNSSFSSNLDEVGMERTASHQQEILRSPPEAFNEETPNEDAEGKEANFPDQASVRDELDAQYGLVAKEPPVFEDLVAEQMKEIVKDMQQDARRKMEEIAAFTEGRAQGEEGTSYSNLIKESSKVLGESELTVEQLRGHESRDLMMEELKMTMQKLSACQQAMSNVVNTMHENAMNPIRNIKA